MTEGRRTMRTCLIVVATLVATSSSAQLYKCTNEEGKTVFSDQRCDAVEKKAPAPNTAIPEAKKTGGRYQPSDAEMERIKSLETSAGKASTTSEERAGLQLVVSGIRSGVDSRMSDGDKAKRDALASQLNNADVAKRSQALADLRVLYGNQ